MSRLILAVCSAMALCLFLAANASAHRVNIFAYVDGGTVVTESGYSKSSRVINGTVEVRNAASNELLLTGTTDEQGAFSFPVPEKALAEKLDLLLIIKAGVGHQGDWTVKYDEIAQAGGAAPAPEAASAPAPEAAVAVPEAASAPVSAPADTAAIEAVVRREIAPVKQMLAEMNQDGPGLTEILGGIGYIFGLFGVAAYMKSRR